MDAKTAITLQQRARKKAKHRKAFAGANVNDMRYSCQGYMGAPECRDGYRWSPTLNRCVRRGYAPPQGQQHRQRRHSRRRMATPSRAALAGSPFPPTCDYCAPCGLYNQSTCTPCAGPGRRQRWGAQWTPDEFGGRMCARPCPPNPCPTDVSWAIHGARMRNPSRAPGLDRRPRSPPRKRSVLRDSSSRRGWHIACPRRKRSRPSSPCVLPDGTSRPTCASASLGRSKRLLRPSIARLRPIAARTSSVMAAYSSAAPGTRTIRGTAWT